MKNQLTKLELRHEILMSEMHLQSRLAKTLEDLLRQEITQVENSFHKNEFVSEVELHSKLAKSLEIQLRYALSRVEECFNEMESLSAELLSLQKEQELHESSLESVG